MYAYSRCICLTISQRHLFGTYTPFLAMSRHTLRYSPTRTVLFGYKTLVHRTNNVLLLLVLYTLRIRCCLLLPFPQCSAQCGATKGITFGLSCIFVYNIHDDPNRKANSRGGWMAAIAFGCRAHIIYRYIRTHNILGLQVTNNFSI